MTAALATSNPAPLIAAASVANRAIPQDGQPSNAGGWQRALKTASQDVRPTATLTQQAGYLLALSQLGATPLEAVAPPSSVALQVAPDPQAQGTAPVATEAGGHAVARPIASTRSDAVASARPWSGTATAKVDAVASDAHAARPVAAVGVSRGIGMKLGDRGSPARVAAWIEPMSSHGGLLAHALAQTSSAHAITTYAAASAAAPVTAERATDFSIESGATAAPVRVHVQWRGHVADVWIGLHRQAFDQLPDIRAGIEDWVQSRGGAVGQLVCNGETLTCVAPSFQFQGEL